DCLKPNLQSAICNLQYLWRQRDDLHERPLAQLASDRPKDASTTRVVFLTDDHGGVVVEANMRAIRAHILFRRPYDHPAHDFALLHRAARRSFFHRRDNHIADEAVAHTRATYDSNAHDLFRAGVVRDLESSLLLNHG